MILLYPTSIRRTHSSVTHVALIITTLCGIAQGGLSEEAKGLEFSTKQQTQVDLNAVFTDVESHATTPNRGSSFKMQPEAASTRAAIDFRSASTLSHSIFGRNQDPGTVRLAQVKEAKPSPVRLVSQQIPPQNPLPLSDVQTSAPPIYTLQQPSFQPTEGSAFAGPSETGDTWVLLAPYGWIAGVSGQVGVGAQTVNIDITPGEVLSHLGKVDGALMLHAEVGKGDWGFILDGNLIRAGTTVTTAPAHIDVTLQQTLIEALGMYRLVDLPDYLVDGKTLSFDLLAGGRFYEFGNVFTVRPLLPVFPTVPLNLSATWVDMLVGARTVIPITSVLEVFGRADIGGFGVGDSSTLAWNLIGGLDLKLTSNSSLIAGYRELNINRSGNVAGSAFGFDAKLYGPFMAVSLQF